MQKHPLVLDFLDGEPVSLEALRREEEQAAKKSKAKKEKRPS
jgi:hypothetical protein